MERKEEIKLQVDKILESVKGIKAVDAPAFFTEKTVSRLRASKSERTTFSYTSLLKIAAILVLLVVNTYTIRYILSTNQPDVATISTATVNDLVNEYQPSDANELTFEEKLDK